MPMQEEKVESRRDAEITGCPTPEPRSTKFPGFLGPKVLRSERMWEMEGKGISPWVVS